MLARLHRSERRATAATLAVELGTSASQVSKVLAAFVDEGLVVAHRGRGGGLEMSEEGLAATAKTVVINVEQERGSESHGDAPKTAPTGRLHEALEAAQRAYLDALDSYTIADLAAAPPASLDLRGVPTIGSQLR